MPYATHDERFIGHEAYSVDMDMELCNLLGTMKLDAAVSIQPGMPDDKTYVVSPWRKQIPDSANLVALSTTPNHQDDIMEEDMNYHSDAASECSSSSSKKQKEPLGCAYLQTIRSHFEDYITTSGEYLDAIFTHRDILYSCPAAHQGCAHAFSDLACMLEKREWRADRDADTEAVAAFRHEAWVIASSFAPVARPQDPPVAQQRSSVCVMQPML